MRFTILLVVEPTPAQSDGLTTWKFQNGKAEENVVKDMGFLKRHPI
ncbi:MAG: hypothetical protein H6617_06610 [Bdellovibrionaceae bacterium]|nr:hypothetical protein [Pseudobdellovibrionaceae bacterium]